MDINKSFLFIGILILVGLVVGGLLFYTPLRLKLSTTSGSAIAVGSVSGSLGSVINLPITFTSGISPVSSLQFDLAIPLGLNYASITVGSAASSAGKSVQANQNGNNLRIIVFGLNQNAISSGLIATAQFNIDPNATFGSRTVTLSGMVASSPSATAVNVSGSNGEVKIQ